jgi:uncharacterized repeat protein (TIGR01451 family)
MFKLSKRHCLVALCATVTVLPAAVAGLGLVSTETSSGQTSCGGPGVTPSPVPSPTPTPTPGPSPTPAPTGSPMPSCPLVLTKAFDPPTITVGASSTLTFVVTNPNPTTVSNFSFGDPLPAGLQIVSAGTNTCGGTLTAVAGGTQIAYVGGSVPGESNCTISVVVTATTSGAFVNQASGITAAGAGTGAPATATLVAQEYPTPLVTDAAITGTTVLFSLRRAAGVTVRIDKRARDPRTYRRLRTLRIAHAKRGRHRLRLPKLHSGHYRVYVRALAPGDLGLGIRRSFKVH